MAEPTGSPGERRLAHPPSDRYRNAETARPPETEAGVDAAPARRLALGAAAALAGAIAITWLGGVLTVTAGLVGVAAATGWGVGACLGHRRGLALSLTVVAIGLGQAGLWAYAQSEGGVLEPLDLLSEVYGWLVPLEFMAGAIAAWIATR